MTPTPSPDVEKALTIEPPSTLSLRYCSTCGRNDRFNHLSDLHYAHGARCAGPVLVARYRRDHPR